MNRAAVYHISEHVFAYPVGPDAIALRLLAARGDLTEARVRFRNMYEHVAPMASMVMAKILTDEEHDVFEALVTIPEKRFRYYFELQGDETVCYTSDGFRSEAGEGNCFFFPYINEDEQPSQPDWAKGAAIYQVLVDRYHDGDPSNNPPGCKARDALPDRDTYYGGDFDGLIEKLPHIASLGMDILYLSPVFLSPTYHKYDTVDYFAIEEIYGGREGLRRLVDAAHAQGVRVLLDGVFNHCSDQHPFFRDVLEKGSSSTYADWFCIFSYDGKGKPVYDSFGGLVPSMPRWNTCHPAVVDYLCEAAVHWTRELDIDGWRLDVADEIPHSFWKTFRRRLRALKPDVFLVGEIWNQAAVWLMGDEFDGVTNYKYRGTMLSLAAGESDADAFWRRTHANLRLYKTTAWPCLVNLLGSHDTARLFTQVPDKRMAALALLVTLCMEGMPLLYYGDEVGMEGGEDPDNRRAMQWDADPCLLDEMRAVGQLRRRTPVLRTGTTVPLASDGSLLRFLRRDDSGSVCVTANFGQEARVLHTGEPPLYSLRAQAGGSGRVRLEAGGLYIVRRE